MTVELWVAAGGVVFLCVISIFIHRSSIRKGRSDVEETIAAVIKKSRTELEKSISPEVIYCSSIDDVRSVAADMISDAARLFAKDSRDNAKNSEEEDYKPLDNSLYFITVYGSASLSNQSEAGRSLSKTDREQSIETYNDALNIAASEQIQFRRYLALIPKQELLARSKGVRKEYIGWLENQISTLKEDANYTLIISPRAPQWGSSNTTILTKKGMIEIKGHGNAAIVISDERIANKMRQSLREDIYKAMLSNRKSINRSNPGTIQWLEEWLTDVKRAK